MDTNKDILFYAFRYALGRQTYAVATVVDEIIEHWNEINNSDQELYHKEIKEAIEQGRAGSQIDINQWRFVLDLKISSI